ncbi:MAG TPA: tetratricopeptide repeat protein, partial [Azospirillum sp.]|nr:tetratricopeptide repeat protein [Azospirillum sp.]
AALVAALDLVISPAMSAGELAGALGVPVWRFGAVDWTQLGAAVRPWFPTMRLFQPRSGETLGDVLVRIGHELRRLAPPPPSKPPVEPAPDPDALLEAAAGHHRRGDLAVAAPLYARVLNLRPGDPVALHLSGLLAHQTGDHEAAVARIGAALERLPAYTAARLSLGGALLALGRPGDAAVHFGCAVALEPGKAAALTNLGNALEALHQLEGAERWQRRAVAADPALAEAHDNLGAVLLRLDRPAEAEQAHRAALTLAPGLATARLNLGVALRQLARPAEALARYREALALAPDVADALGNLVRLLREGNRAGDAEVWGRRALALDPQHPSAHFNLGLLNLARGTLAAGWAGYDHRFRDLAFAGAVRRVSAPSWQGEDLTGKRILVWREQGIGDQILFASCLPDVVAGAGRVIVECDPRLVPLFARSFPTAEVRPATDGEAPAVDVHAPIGSLPRWLRPESGTFPARPAYLSADPARHRVWRERLAALGPGPAVGICWRSGLMTAERRAAYTRLNDWGPVFAVPGVRFVNLQYDDCAAELAEAERRFGVTIHRWPDLDLKNDLEGVAALMANLDLVISPATSVGELAAALGTPTWRFGVTDWTQLGTAVRPWFPAMRIFPPRPGETLADVLARIAGALRAP